MLGEATAALLGGALAGWSLRAVGWATAAEAALPLMIALALPAASGGRTGAVSPARLPRAVAEALRGVTTRLLFANMVAWGLATFIAVWLLQPYWQGQGIGLRWFGALWAATLLTVGAVGRAAPALTRRIGQRGALLALTLAPIVAYAGMAATGGGAGVAFGLLFYVSRGLNGVNLREAFNHEIPSHLRATINSVASGAFRLCYAAIAPAVGLIVDRAGINAALAALAGLFLLVFAVLAVPLLRRLPGRQVRRSGAG